MFEKNEALGERLFKECFSLIANGEIRVPATVKEVSYADVVKGFRLLQMGKHTGKVCALLLYTQFLTCSLTTILDRPCPPRK